MDVFWSHFSPSPYNLPWNDAISCGAERRHPSGSWRFQVPKEPETHRNEWADRPSVGSSSVLVPMWPQCPHCVLCLRQKMLSARSPALSFQPPPASPQGARRIRKAAKPPAAGGPPCGQLFSFGTISILPSHPKTSEIPLTFANRVSQPASERFVVDG